jgi:hypothetical protein
MTYSRRAHQPDFPQHRCEAVSDLSAGRCSNAATESRDGRPVCMLHWQSHEVEWAGNWVDSQLSFDV